MELLFKTITEPGCYMYLSGIFIVILGAIIGVTPPDSRKNLHTSMAIPLFIAAGLSHIFHSFDYLANKGSYAGIHTLLHIIAFSSAFELGRLNINTAFKGKSFSPYWHILTTFLFLFFSWNYDETYRIITLLMVCAGKIFAIAVTLNVNDKLATATKKAVKTCFVISIFGSIIQLFIDLPFVKIVDGHYLQPPEYVLYLYLFETIMALAISVIVLKRRYNYENSKKLHTPNKIILFSPSTVFATSILLSIFVLAFTNFLTEREIMKNSLESVSENHNLKHAIRQRIDYSVSTARLMAENPIWPSFLLTEDSEIKADLKKFLTAFHKYNPGMHVFIMDASGTVVLTSDSDENAYGLTNTNRDYYQKAMEGKASLSILRGEYTKTFGFYANYPVFSTDKKQILGVVGLKTDLTEIDRLISLSKYPTMFISTNNNGRILMANNRDYVNKQCGDLSSYIDNGLYPVEVVPLFNESVKNKAFFSITSIYSNNWGILSLSKLETDNTTQVWLLFIALLVIIILYVILYGITLNGETQKTVETAQTNFKRIFDSAPDPICIIDADSSVILGMNRSMEEHFGYGPSMVGQKLFDFVVSEKAFNCDVFEHDESIVSECVFKKATGDFFSAEVTASYFELDSGIRSVLIGIHDISMFKAIEEKLIQAKNSAEEASQLKTRFFANASHEIRTPMTAIIGLTELAVSVCYNDNQRKIIELLRFSSKSLMSLINDIFGLTEIQSGKLKITNSTFKFKTLLDEVISYSKFHAQRENKKISYRLSKYLPEYICSDLEHLRQIMLGSIKQALELCMNNNIEIEIDFCDEKQNSGNIVFRLLKIVAEKRSEIESSINSEFGFNPYEASSSRKHSIGISLNSMIIDAMGGKINLKPDHEDSNYLEIDITVPVETIESKSVDEEDVNDCLFYSKGKPIKFLVADDNDVNLFLAESIIRRFKGECYCVKDGLETLEVLKKNDFDIILLDIQMPKMDGMKVLEEKKKMSGPIADTPVIAISAFASAEEKEKALNFGATTYLSKPYFPKDLIFAVEAIIPLDKTLPVSVKADEIAQTIESYIPKADDEDKNKFTSVEQRLQSKLRRIDYADFKKRISPKPESMKQLIDIYTRRYTTLDIEVDNCINENDSSKLREVAHSIKGLVGMMSAKYSWEIARSIEKSAADGNMDEAISHISELRLHLTEIGDDLLQIQEYLDKES